jgi:hypothetical protein
MRRALGLAMGQTAGMAEGWRERYLGGSPEAESALFERFGAEITDIQDRFRRRDRSPAVRRPFHAKTVAAIEGCRFEVVDDLDPDLQAGVLRPGARLAATVRFSNASGSVRADPMPDLRGVAVRVHDPPAGFQDLLLTSAPASHARDARQFMAAARVAGEPPLRRLVHALVALGPREGIRMALVVMRDEARPVHSLAAQRFWSRGAFAVGDVAVRLRLEPAAGPGGLVRGYDGLGHDLAARLRQRDVVFFLQAQRFVDERRTPIEDSSVRWRERDSPPETVARLTIPRQDLSAPDAVARAEAVEALAFDPWNTTSPSGIRPLGSQNRARRVVYPASARHRGA